MMTRRFFCQSTLALMLHGALSGCQPTQQTQTFRITHHDDKQPFPVQIQHALGKTTLFRQPERVVILGTQTPDIVFELGVMPVAIEANFWGGNDAGYLAWYQQAIEQSGQKLPELINMYPEPDVEKLSLLKTDLILAPQSGMTAPLFEQLSAIAPVIPYPQRAWLTPIEDIIDVCAAALGRQPEALKLKAKIAQQYAEIQKKYPQFQQHQFAYIYTNGRQGNLAVFTPTDTRVAVLQQMGLKLAPFVSQLPLKMGAFTSEMGLENADKLDDVDILITWFNTEQERDLMAQQPLFARIPAVKRGAYIALTDRALVTAMSYGTPLALDWALPRFVPLLLRAMERVKR